MHALTVVHALTIMHALTSAVQSEQSLFDATRQQHHDIDKVLKPCTCLFSCLLLMYSSLHYVAGPMPHHNRQEGVRMHVQ